MFKKISLFLVAVVTTSITIGISLQVVYAAPPTYGCPGGPIGPGAPSSCPYTSEQAAAYCADPSTIPAGQSLYCSNGGGGVVETMRSTTASTSSSPGVYSGDCKVGQTENLDKSNCGIVGIIIDVTNILSAVVGIVVVLMVVVGGIQYSASRDNPQATAAAKARIRNAIMALVAYLFVYAFLQYLIPGGIF